ncbi:RNA-directed DNA polymerase from mobile element jockey [Trichonephila clavipes]|nr:RNA-directed DNA polymerase from mobile element jockey [Trichonephila clavipes]
MQRFLDILEKWLTGWRIAINVEKTQAIVFRKWGVIDPQAELTLFDDNIHWVPVVCYLGLHIDSRLTYKKHIDYLSDKFWGRIALAISLIGRSSPLSLENKVIPYKQILRPTITLFYFSFRLQKKQQHFPSHCVLGAPRMRFGAVKPPLPAIFHPRPRDVLQFRPRSAVLFLQPPPAGE